MWGKCGENYLPLFHHFTPHNYEGNINFKKNSKTS